MKGLIKVLATVSAVFAIISCLVIVAVADENEIVVEDQETIPPYVSDELLAICMSTPSDSVYGTYNTTNDHPWWCQGSDGEISHGEYVLDCYCVDHAITSSVSVHVYYTTEDLRATEVSDINARYDSRYPNATRIFDANGDYNCHSYAWYSQDVLSNNYWMDYPYPYYEETDLYEETSTPQVGDIVCYFNGNVIKHSGIIVALGDNANTYVVQSKWGAAGVYEHLANYCPYPTSYKYYQRVDHTHTFAKADYNSDWHKKYCTGCGVTIWEEHDHSTVVSKNSNGHTLSCACGDTVTKSHSYNYQTYSEHHHKKYCDCGYITYVAHNYEYTYVNDQIHTKTCTLCHASYQDAHYEEAYSVEDNGDGSHDITCICEGIFEEDASHVYNRYSDYNGVYHKVSCICGDYELEAHELSYEYEDGDGYHWEWCEICGYEDYPEHSYTTKSYYDLNHHKAYCDCGDYIISHHDNYTEVSHNNLYHTVKVDCCDSRTVTFIHHYDEYDSDSHTGDCSYCSYTATTDLSHVVPYSNIGGGKHSGKCNWCDYTHTEPHSYMYTCISYSSHQIECEGCDNYQVVADHTWDEYYDEEGDLITYCSGCQYIAGSSPLSLDMIEKLPLEIQSALDGATQNALLNATEEQTVSVVIRIDDEYGILYFNGRYYLLYTPIEPDAEVAPVTPSEESIS